MDETEPGNTSWLGALRRVGFGLVRIAQCRSELLSVELQEEKYRVVGLLLLAGVALVCGMLAAMALTALAVWLCPAGIRPYVLGGFGVVYVVLAGVALGALRRELRHRPPPLAGTVEELRKDVEWPRSKI